MFQPNLMEAGQLHHVVLDHIAQNTSESDIARNLGRDDDFDSATKSGSENHEGGAASGDDQEGQPRQKKKRYHRHTQHQIQEMEA